MTIRTLRSRHLSAAALTTALLALLALYPATVQADCPRGQLLSYAGNAA